MKSKLSLILCFLVGCSPNPETLRKEKPTFFDEIVGEWIILKENKKIGQPEIKDIARLIFREDGTVNFKTLLSTEENSFLSIFKHWRLCENLQWKPARNAVSGDIAERTFSIYCSEPSYKFFLQIDDDFVTNFKEIKRANILNSSDDFFFIKRNEKNPDSLISDLKNQELKTNKHLYDDLNTLENMSIDYTKFDLVEGDTELQKNERQRQKVKIFDEHLKKIKGKQIILNLVKMISLEEQIELNAKGKSLKNKINILVEKIVFGIDEPGDKQTLISLRLQLNECNTCHTGNIFYQSEFEISEDNHLAKDKYNNLHIFKNLDKSEALKLKKGETIKIKGKISNVIFGWDATTGEDYLSKIYLD